MVTDDQLEAMRYEWRRTGGLTRRDTGDVLDALTESRAALARAEQALAEIVGAVDGQSVTVHGARFIREIAVQALAAATTTTQPPAAASSEGGR